MSDRRNTATTPTPTESRSMGRQMPHLGGWVGKFGGIAGGCLGFIFLCILGFMVTGWWGWNEVKPQAQPQLPVMKANTYDPLGCAAKGEWVMSWDTAQGKKYACTPKWK